MSAPVVALLVGSALLAVVVVAPAARGAVPGAPPYGWSIGTIASFTDAGVYTSIALDTSGNPYVSFVDGTNGTVDLAHRFGGTWSVQRVDGPGAFAGYTNVVVASDGSIRMSYYDTVTRQVKYAVHTGTGWQIEDVDGGLQEGFNRLVLDSSGRPALAYVSFNGWLRYAWWNGTAWMRETVDNVSILSRYPDLTLDAAGNPKISYYADGLLRYASKSSGVWSREIADSDLYVGWFSRIQVAANGEVHIAYYDSDNGSLRWATRTNGAWSHTVLEGNDDAGWDVSLATDALGRVHLAYYARLTGALRYAVNTTTGWVRETADEGGVVGWYSSITTDTLGLPHISFYDWTNGRLQVADGRVALQARTLGAQPGSASSATLTGELVAFGNHSSAAVGFQFRAQGGSSWTYLPHGPVVSAGTYVVVVGNLTAGVTYEFRAQASSGNETSFGSVVAFAFPTPTPTSPYGSLPYAILTLATIGAVAVAYLVHRRRSRGRAQP